MDPLENPLLNTEAPNDYFQLRESTGTTDDAQKAVNDRQPSNYSSESNKNEVIEEDEDEKNCLHRWFGPVGSGSLRGSTFAMASITFGGGCLAFPYAISQTGPIIGLIIFIIVAGLSYYTLKILLDDGVKAKIMDYNRLLLFTNGNKMVIFSDINNIIMVLGCIMSYQLTVYKFALEFGEKHFELDSKNATNKIILMSVCAVCFQIPLSTLKNISTLQYASLVGTFALIYSIVVIVCEMPFYFKNYIAENTITWFPPISLGYLDTFSTLMFGFASHNGIYQVFTELKRPTVIRYYKVLKRSFVIEIILYSAIAFGGYFSTFDKTEDLFLKRPDLPGFHDIFIDFSKVALFICLHCTMAINYNIMRGSFRTFLFNDKDIPFIWDFLLIVCTYSITNVMVFFIENVTQILGVIGGVCTIVICFINPILIHIKLSGLPHTHISNLLAYVIMIFVTLIGFAATVKSLMFTFFPQIKV